jgi:hypothetical protein
MLGDYLSGPEKARTSDRADAYVTWHVYKLVGAEQFFDVKLELACSAMVGGHC